MLEKAQAQAERAALSIIDDVLVAIANRTMSALNGYPDKIRNGTSSPPPVEICTFTR